MPRRSTPNPLGQAIGLRIRQLRGEQGVTAEKLAYESEVGSKGFLSDIEHGLALPSLQTLERIAHRLDVALFDLLVFPEDGNRERLIDRTRHIPKGSLARMLREVADADNVIATSPLPEPRHSIRAYVTLEVAAGWSTEAVPRGETKSESLRLPGKFARSSDFAVRASGSSMLGFRSTIRDGDWLVLRKTTASPDAVLGQIVLVAREDKYGDKSLHIKRIVQTGRRYWLRSDDPNTPAMVATEADTIIGTLVRVVTPESLAPKPRTRFAKSKLAAVFGISRAPERVWSRIDGHLFFLVNAAEFKAKSGLAVPDCVPRPAETAFLLLSDDDQVEYRGLMRFDTTRDAWRVPRG